MIKINLLTGGGPTVATTEAAPQAPGLRLFLIVAFTVLVGAGVDFGFYRVWSGQLAHEQAELKKEQLRQTELRGVQEQNRLYQQQLQQLETRINTIQTLQNSKSGPVAFMNALGETVNKTADLYLFTVDPAGDRYSIKGQSTTVESMAQFIAALKRSGSFQDVQLRQYYEDDQQNRLAYKFTLDCIYKSPGGAAATAPGGAPPNAPAAAPGERRTGM